MAIDGEPLTIFPPGLPVVLGLCLRAGLDAEIAAVSLNLLCLEATILLTYFIGSTVLSSARLGIVSTCLVALSSSVLRVFGSVWSEPLFTTLALVAVWLVADACRRPSPMSWPRLFAIAGFVSLATTVRFVGFTLIPIAALGAWFASRGGALGRGRSLGRAMIAALASGVGFSAVALRNLSLGVPPLGERYVSDYTLILVLQRCAGVLGSFVTGKTLLAGLAAGLVGCLLAASLVTATWWEWRSGHSAALILASWTGVWWGVLIYSELATRIDAVDERLVVPILPVMVVLIVGFCADVVRRANSSLGEGRSNRTGVPAARWRCLLVRLTGASIACLCAVTVVRSAADSVVSVHSRYVGGGVQLAERRELSARSRSQRLAGRLGNRVD
jgi:hypothetical protein